MNRKNLKRYFLFKSFICSTLFIHSISVGWAESAESKIESLDTMVVTGSHILNSSSAGTTPLAVIDKDFIERSGATTINELFRNTIYNSAGMIDEQFTQGFAPASSGINLRGLGLSRTLVLLDGRRLPIFPFAQSTIGQNTNDSFVDINVIPLSAVERIEILKDGASGVYGADAVAGVVNIITNKSYDGGKISGQYGGTLKVDGEEGRAEILAGKTWENTNLTLSFDYLNRSEIKAKGRKYSDSALGPIDDRSNAGNPGSIIDLAAGGPPSPDPRCPSDQVRGFFCSFDFAPYNTLIPEVERTGFMGSFDHQFNESIGFFARGLFSHTSSERSLAPAPINDILILDPTNPNNLSGGPLGVIYRFNELGPRIDEFLTDTYNAVWGLNGQVLEWNWELGFGVGQVETRNKGINGYATQTSMQNAVDAGLLNPLGESPNFDPASVMLTPTRKGRSKIYYVDFKADGTLLDSDYGSLKLAIGSDIRREKFTDSFDSVTLAGDVLGVGGTSGSGGRQIEAAYFELVASLFDQLDMQFAARMDHYSDFGTTFNPKFSLRWQPNDYVGFRGNVGTGFKAPALHELHAGEISGFEAVFDPVTQSVTQVDLITSGNQNLDPEESFNHGMGIIVTPTNWWDLSLDYWNIRNDNAVISSPQFYINNEALFPGNVSRDPDTGELISVFSPFRNVASQKLWGLDMNTSMNFDIPKVGFFKFDIGGTYLGSFRQESFPGDGFTQLAGKDGMPRWRAQGRITYIKSDYEFSFTTNFVDGYERSLGDGVPGADVGSWTTLDMQAVWRPSMLEGTSVAVGANNILNEAPPFDPFYEGWPFFNRSLASPRGRFLYLRAQYEF